MMAFISNAGRQAAICLVAFLLRQCVHKKGPGVVLLSPGHLSESREERGVNLQWPAECAYAVSLLPKAAG